MSLSVLVRTKATSRSNCVDLQYCETNSRSPNFKKRTRFCVSKTLYVCSKFSACRIFFHDAACSLEFRCQRSSVSLNKYSTIHRDSEVTFQIHSAIRQSVRESREQGGDFSLQQTRTCMSALLPSLHSPDHSLWKGNCCTVKRAWFFWTWMGLPPLKERVHWKNFWTWEQRQRRLSAPSTHSVVRTDPYFARLMWWLINPVRNWCVTFDSKSRAIVSAVNRGLRSNYVTIRLSK